MVTLNIKIILILSTAFFFKFLSIIFMPEIGGDTIGYQNVALNILYNFCVSLSDPATKECVPHWGGNQLPGYPAFLALNYWLFGVKNIYPLITAAIIFQLSVFLLSRELIKYKYDHRAILITILVLSFSPIHFAQTRYMLTEELTLSLTIYFLTVIIKFIHEKNINLFNLAFIFSLLFFIRYDSIILLAPISYLFLVFFKGKKLFLNSVIFLLIISLPISAITIRNINVNLKIIPEPKYIFDGSKNPNGYIEWAKLWIHNTDHQEKIIYPLAYFKYNQIRIPEKTYLNLNCENKAKKLINELKKFDGKPFPLYLDSSFNKLSKDSDCKISFEDKLKLIAKRTYSLWGNFPSSFGWPTSEFGLKKRIYQEIDGALSFEISSIKKLILTLKDNLPAILVRIISNFYWLTLIVLMFGCYYFLRNSSSVPKIFFRVTILYIVSKTSFLLLIGTPLEPRLLVSLYPFIQTMIFLFIVPIFINKKCDNTLNRF